jgi:hypothetical protein
MASVLTSRACSFTLANVSQAAWSHGSNWAPTVPPQTAACSAFFSTSAQVNRPLDGMPLLMNAWSSLRCPWLSA